MSGGGWGGEGGGVNRAVCVGSRERLAKGIIHFSPPFVCVERGKVGKRHLSHLPTCCIQGREAEFTLPTQHCVGGGGGIEGEVGER